MNDTPEMLTADRHRFLREHLMSEITAETSAPRSRRRQVWWIAPPLAIAAVAAVTVVGPGRHADSHGPAVPAASATAEPTVSATPAPDPTVSATPAPEPTDAAGLLSRAAKAAASRPDPGAGNAQFTYQREITDGARQSKHERTTWMPVDGRSSGLIADPTMSGADGNGRVTWPAALGTATGAPTKASFYVPTYEFVASLPTDPQQLLEQLLAADRSKEVVGTSTKEMRNQLAFWDVQKIFQNVTAPPAVAGALMEAAAKIPGTAVVADEVDAAGRHGVAVVGTNGTMRVSLIFDTRSGAFLGVRQVLLTDLPPGGPDGLPPVGSPSPGAGSGKGYDFATAVLRAGIVDRPGDEPVS
ncbi:CU044_5270 family protein [Kitasatospora sp. NPDC050463]|uniref:CU044_5270 family protein n=1 Tax=Kitasatospora sp. NPDC050463 TaxID=3155786 RepID=UPI0033E6913B